MGGKINFKTNKKYPFILPNYNGESIVNLMSSISNNFGKKHSYVELDSLNSKELKQAKNVVLIIMDGMGYEYLIKQKSSFLLKYLRSMMTSTFLSTTACAKVTFDVGYPPMQHGLTGWDVNLKEVGAITSVLPFSPAYHGESLVNNGFKVSDMMDISPYAKGFKCKSYTLLNQMIAFSPFSKYVHSCTQILSYKNYKDGFNQLAKLVKKNSKNRQYIQFYLDSFDHAAHVNGMKSKEVKNAFDEFDSRMSALVRSIKNTNTKLIITADHGLIDVKDDEKIYAKKIVGFDECLSIPLCGEPRVCDCFVRPRKVKEFEKIVKTKLSKYLWVYKGEDLIKDNLYGLFQPSKRLINRVGDYVLIMKGNYVMKYDYANYDELHKNKKKKSSVNGNHGGITRDEMLVPLIVIDC